MALSDELETLHKLRIQLQEEAVVVFEDDVARFAENAARRIAASLGVSPDLIFDPDGDDGVRVGRTAWEERLSALSGVPRIQAAVLAAELAEIEDFVDASGMDRARQNLREYVARLAGVAEQTFDVQGVANAIGALDNVASEGLIGSYIDANIDDVIRKTIDGPAAIRIRDAISSNLGLVSIEELAFNIAEQEIQTIGRAQTEARTRLAEADRFVQETTRKTLDPDDTIFALAYTGPKRVPGLPRSKDPIRPFCEHLVGKVFEIEVFNKANNQQKPGHPRYTGGGYNCRHSVTPVINADRSIKALGYERGTAEDIKKANEAAKKARRKKGRRRR